VAPFDDETGEAVATAPAAAENLPNGPAKAVPRQARDALSLSKGGHYVSLGVTLQAGSFRLGSRELLASFGETRRSAGGAKAVWTRRFHNCAQPSGER
jgi:hypothetical protein